jgi:hypothetical protein
MPTQAVRVGPAGSVLAITGLVPAHPCHGKARRSPGSRTGRYARFRRSSQARNTPPMRPVGVQRIHHHEGSDRQDDDPHAVRGGSPGRTTGAVPPGHEPMNKARADREHQRPRWCTHPAALGSWAERLPRCVVTSLLCEGPHSRDGVAQLERDARRLTSNGHGRDVPSGWCAGSPAQSELTWGSVGLPGVTSPGLESLRDFVW